MEPNHESQAPFDPFSVVLSQPNLRSLDCAVIHVDQVKIMFFICTWLATKIHVDRNEGPLFYPEVSRIFFICTRRSARAGAAAPRSVCGMEARCRGLQRNCGGRRGA
jgi:hypothetical protein